MGHPAVDFIEGRVPEVGGCQIVAEGAGDGGFRGRAAGRREEVGITFGEAVGVVLGQREEAEREEIAEGIGEVVKGNLRDIEMELAGPEERVVAILGKGLTIAGALRGEHDLAEFLRWEFPRGATAVEFVFKHEPRVDVHAKGDGVAKHRVENGEAFGVAGGLLQAYTAQDMFGEGAGGFGEIHRVVAQEEGFGAQHMGMVGVAEFVREGRHAVGAIGESHENAALAGAGQVGAETALAFASTVLGFDPAVAQRHRSKIPQMGAEAVKCL